MLDAGIFDALKGAGLPLDGYSLDMATGAVMETEPLDPDARARIVAVITAYRPAPAIVSLAVIDLYRAMTDDEFSRMQAGVATQSPRIQGIFARAVTFRSDAPEWPLLQQMAETLYGKERAAELLTPPA